MNTPTRIILMSSIWPGLAFAQEAERNKPPGAPDRPPVPPEARPFNGERRQPEGERRRVEGDRPEGERPRADNERPEGERARRRVEGETRREGDRRPDADQNRGPGDRGPQPGERGGGEGNIRPGARSMGPGGGEGGSRRDMLVRLPQKPQPYIGIITRHAGPDLTAQLKQPEGFGLVVDEVLPDSPAKGAGLERNDLILRFDDQALVNSAQLEALIRRAGKDKEASLTILRGGAEQKITLRVGEKLLPERRGLPLENADRMQMPMLPGQTRPYPNPRMQPLGGSAGAEPHREGGDRQIRYSDNRAKAVRSDEQGRYELNSINGTRTFTAQKPDGSVQWQGPVETAAQKEGVPAELKSKLELLERTMSPGNRDGERARTNRD